LPDGFDISPFERSALKGGNKGRGNTKRRPAKQAFPLKRFQYMFLRLSGSTPPAAARQAKQNPNKKNMKKLKKMFMKKIEL